MSNQADNHLTKKKEIVVQDYNNVLYLISSDGKILWKKQLLGPVQGKIKQVDIFKKIDNNICCIKN